MNEPVTEPDAPPLHIAASASVIVIISVVGIFVAFFSGLFHGDRCGRGDGYLVVVVVLLRREELVARVAAAPARRETEKHELTPHAPAGRRGVA